MPYDTITTHNGEGVAALVSSQHTEQSTASSFHPAHVLNDSCFPGHRFLLQCMNEWMSGSSSKIPAEWRNLQSKLLVCILTKPKSYLLFMSSKPVCCSVTCHTPKVLLITASWFSQTHSFEQRLRIWSRPEWLSEWSSQSHPGFGFVTLEASQYFSIAAYNGISNRGKERFQGIESTMISVRTCYPTATCYENARASIYWIRVIGNVRLDLCLSASCSAWMSQAQTEFKKVAGANVTLPCHHRLHLLESTSLDIEWLLQNSEVNHKAVGLPDSSRFMVGTFYPQIDSRRNKKKTLFALTYASIWSRCGTMSGLSTLWASWKCKMRNDSHTFGHVDATKLAEQ